MSYFFLGDIIFDIANKERGVLVVKLGPSNFNYWKRTGKAGCATCLFFFIPMGTKNEYELYLKVF